MTINDFSMSTVCASRTKPNFTARLGSLSPILVAKLGTVWSSYVLSYGHCKPSVMIYFSLGMPKCRAFLGHSQQSLSLCRCENPDPYPAASHVLSACLTWYQTNWQTCLRQRGVPWGGAWTLQMSLSERVLALELGHEGEVVLVGR